MGTLLSEEITLLTVKKEAGKVIKVMTSGVGVKNALKSCAKRT